MEILDDHHCIAKYTNAFVDVVLCMACTDARTCLAWLQEIIARVLPSKYGTDYCPLCQFTGYR